MSNISSTPSDSKRNWLSNFVNAFQNLRIGQKIISGSIVALALLVIITTLVLINLNALTADFNFLVEHDQPVLFNAARLEKLVIDMETGQRGFIITGQDEFLEPYNNGQAEFDQLLEEQKVLVSDNPPQVARLEEIRLLHEEWVTLAAEPEIAKRREVNQATVTSETLQEILRGGVGKGILDELRGVLDEMEASFRAADNLPAAILTVQIAKDMVDQETGERGFIITGEENFLEPYNAGQEALTEHIAELRKLVANDPTNSARLDQVESLANDWVEQAAVPEIQARRDLDAAPATIADVSAMLQAGTGKAILDETRAKFAEFTAIELALTQQRSEAAKQVNRNLIILAIGLTVLGAVIVLGSGIFIAGTITTSLNSLTKASQTIIDGDLNTEVAVTSKDETGVLAGTFNSMTLQLRQTLDNVNKRAAQLATVAQVSTNTSTVLDPFQMVATAVRLTQRGFNLYHAHVFEYNKTTDELQIVACGYKEGDEHEGTHGTAHIPLQREQSLVARAARTRKPVIVNDVRSDPGWLPNPLLPETRAELAVPMVVGNELVGVLDVQSEYVDAFNEEDATIQMTLAAQLAVAMKNAQSYSTARDKAKLETLVNTIGQKIQRAGTVEDTLQIAIRELGLALGASRVKAHIEHPDKVASQSTDS